MKTRRLLLFFLLCVFLFAARAFPQEKQQTWMEVRSPHFVVATNGSEKQARRIADQFEQIRGIFEQTLKIRVDSGKSFTILALKDEKTMRTLMPEFWERKGLVHPAGYFVPGSDKQYAVVRLDVSGENPYHTLYHEYTHMVVHLNVRSLPLWMSEGLADFYGNSVLGEKEVGLGRPDAQTILRLRDTRLLPLDDLFQVTHGSPHYTEDTKASVFYAESWALTHYLLLGEKRAPGQRNRLSLFLELLLKDVDEEEAAQQVFGDLERLQKTLAEYLRQVSFPYLRFKSAAATKPEEFSARALPPAETAALLGDFQLHDRRPQDALPLLEEALRLQPDLAAAQESMGFLHFQQGNRAEAARWFDQAVAGNSRSFLAHYHHAMLAMTGYGGPDVVEQAEASLNRTIQLNPLFANAYVSLAGLCLRDEKKLDRALQLARKGVELEPGVVANQLMFGNVLVRMGRFDDAQKFAKSMEQAASTPQDQAMVAAFVRSLSRFQDSMERVKQAEANAREAEAFESRRQQQSTGVEKPAERTSEVRQEPATAPGPQKPPQPGEVGTVKGKVTAVGCKASVIELSIDMGGSTLKLRASDYHKVELTASQGAMLPGFSICEHLLELPVAVKFKATETGPGQLIAIALP